MDFRAFEWGIAAPIILSSVLLSSVVVWGLEAFRGWLSKRQQAKYLQLKLSVIFETYAAQCVRQVGLHEWHVESGGSSGGEIWHLAALPAFPDMPEVWPLIDTRLADRALQFGVLISTRNTNQHDYMDVVGMHDLTGAVRDHLQVGFKALILSRDLREKAGLGQTEMGEDLRKAFDVERSNWKLKKLV